MTNTVHLSRVFREEILTPCTIQCRAISDYAEGKCYCHLFEINETQQGFYGSIHSGMQYMTFTGNWKFKPGTTGPSLNVIYDTGIE